MKNELKKGYSDLSKSCEEVLSKKYGIANHTAHYDLCHVVPITICDVKKRNSKPNNMM